VEFQLNIYYPGMVRFKFLKKMQSMKNINSQSYKYFLFNLNNIYIHRNGNIFNILIVDL